MKRYIAIGFLFFISCGKQDPNEQIQYLDGYWEIEKAILANGTEKQFTISTTIDFIFVSEDHSICKKVSPKLYSRFLRIQCSSVTSITSIMVLKIK